MTILRSYGDPCGIARALDLVGERWALLIVRELLFGPKRFTDLRAGLTGASPNVLSQRLRELEAGGVVRRHRVGAPTYALTDLGRELHPFLLQLGRWGIRVSERPAGQLSVDALMVALEANFLAQDAADFRATYALDFGEDRFLVEIDRGTIAIGRGSPRQPDTVIQADPTTLRAIIFGEIKLAGAPVEFHGDKGLGRMFFRLFSKPEIARGSLRSRLPA